MSPGLVYFGETLPSFVQGECRVIALSETTRDQVVQSINLFLASLVYRVLIVSYEVKKTREKSTANPLSEVWPRGWTLLIV